MKAIYCSKADPESKCDYVVRGKDDEEVLRNAKEHERKGHGKEMTPEMAEKVKSFIEEV